MVIPVCHSTIPLQWNIKCFIRPDRKRRKASHTKDKQTPGSTCIFCGKTHEFKRIMPPVDREYHKCNEEKRTLCYCLPVRQKPLHTFGDEENVSEEECYMSVKKKHMQSLAQARNPTKSWSPVQSTDNMR